MENKEHKDNGLEERKREGKRCDKEEDYSKKNENVINMKIQINYIHYQVRDFL